MLTPEIIALGNRWLPDVNFNRNERAPVAPGLRLSNPCGACRILDYFEERGSRVTQGVSSVGHLYADWFIETLLKPGVQQWCSEQYPELPAEEVAVEPLFNWGAGESGLDSLVENTAYRAHYEYKTSSQKDPKPSRDNIEQVVRQRVNIARNRKQGYDEIPQSVIFIIGKSGHFSSYVYGPFEIAPTPEQYAAAERDMDLTCAVFRDCKDDGADPRSHPLIRDLQRSGCYDCFPIEIQPADDDLQALLDDEWHAHIHGYDAAVAWRADIERQIKLIVPKGEKKQTGRYIAHHQKNGALKIKLI